MLKILFITILYLSFSASSYAEVVECETKWPQSCGVLKPDPGGFPTTRDSIQALEDVYSKGINLTEIIGNSEEKPKILCMSSKFKSETEGQKFFAKSLSKYKVLINENILAAIVPTLVIAEYKSGVTVAIGHGSDYFCVNDRGNHILFGSSSR